MRAVALIAAALLAATAFAQLRAIPQDAKRAKMSFVWERIVTLDGKREILAPGARIRDATNRIIVPSALPTNSLVRYRRDPSGAVYEVWILTADEAKKKE